jgi:hypothetical protein
LARLNSSVPVPSSSRVNGFAVNAGSPPRCQGIDAARSDYTPSTSRREELTWQRLEGDANGDGAELPRRTFEIDVLARGGPDEAIVRIGEVINLAHYGSDVLHASCFDGASLRAGKTGGPCRDQPEPALRQQATRKKRRTLSDTYGWFTEGLTQRI